MMSNYEKLKISLRYFLLGRQYYRAADALEFASGIHVGLRKDGVTPEFQHQIEIAHYVRSILPSLMFPEETITAVILHDTKEDYGVLLDVINDRYGFKVARAVDLLDKNGKEPDQYFQGIATDSIASIVKGADRMHNVQSMVGVFSEEKQYKYINEVEQHFLPMLKQARRRFPSQEMAYENIKHVLLSQVELINVILGRVR